MTREWFKYSISKERFHNNDDRFSFTDQQLIEDNDIYKKRFIYSNFIKNELCSNVYKYFTKNLENKETLFIGSSWAWWEYFLMKKIDLTASDINQNYINFHKNFSELKYIKLNILDENSVNSLEKKYDQIVINNIEYLFDDLQLEKSIKNIYKISKKGAKIFVVFRSRDGLLQKIIDKYLAKFEMFLFYLIKKIRNKVYFNKSHQGYKRNINNFISFYKKENFIFKSLFTGMYEGEYERLKIIKRLKLSKLFSIIFFKSHPYLNIIYFEKK